MLITRIGADYANSFVTLDQANTILPTVCPDDLTEWNALTDTQKEFRLTIAAQVLGYLPLRGKKTYKNQALCFPRMYWDREEEVWTAEEEYELDFHRAFRVPQEVKEAQCMVAFSVVHRGLANRPEVDEEAGMTVTSVSLGGMLSVGFGDGKVSGTALDKLMLSPQSLIYFKMKRFIAQFRGWATPDIYDEDYYSPLTALTSTTTTTSTVSSTSTSSSTTTTTTAP